MRGIESLVVGIGIGLAAGIGGYTFVYARGASYLTDDPAACANCHVMREYHDRWLAASHRAAAVCNDCHTPAGLVPKYGVKALNGFNHSLAFTTGRFPEPLRITARNAAIAEAACRRCHTRAVEAVDGVQPPGRTLACARCHARVGHL
jgi:cytochrome c nitrite reductase small subunit